MTCTDCKFAVFAICTFTIDVETGFQRKGERVKIEQINDEILVIDDFLTRDEEEHINHNFKVLSGDIIGQTMSSFHLSDLAGTYLLPVKDRPDRQSCADELEASELWSFLAGFWKRFLTLHSFDITLLGVYANGQTFGQDTIIHRDNKTHPGLTVIVFCNEHWPTSWGGELVFYDDKKENVIKSVLPKSRRVVIFDGRIPHAARSPSVKCDQVRMTLAFKTVIKE